MPYLSDPKRHVSTRQKMATIAEIADYLNVTQRALKGWIASGDFPRGNRIGRRAVRWRWSVVENWIDSRSEK